MLGRVIDSYRVTKDLLGPGRYEVQHLQQGLLVLRLLPLEDGAMPTAVLKVALRLCQLSHRNLERVMHAGLLQPEGTPFLVQEVPAGEPLSEHLLRRGPLSPREALALLAQAAAGLSALHQAGVAHRNLSLATVRILSGGSIKLGDVLPAPSPAAAPGTSSSEDMRDDLWHLGAVFCDLLGIADQVLAAAAAPAGPSGPYRHLSDVLRRLVFPDRGGAQGPHSALELYARVEAAVRKSGLLDSDDLSTSTPALRLSNPPRQWQQSPQAVPVAFDDDEGDLTQPVPAVAPQKVPATEDEAATVEVERMDAAELAPFFPPGAQPVTNLTKLVGPLEQQQQQQRPPSAPDHLPAQATSISTDSITRERPGPERWLWPLGIAALLTLSLAIWVLVRPPGRHGPSSAAPAQSLEPAR